MRIQLLLALPLGCLLMAGGSPSLSAAEIAADNNAKSTTKTTAKTTTNTTTTDEMAMKAAMQPGPEHEMLGKYAGSWDVKCLMRMKPDTEMIESKGSSDIEAILDKHFYQEKFEGTFHDKEFNGLSLIGYDRLANHYTLTWCDDLSTCFVYLTGKSTDSGKTITFTGEKTMPMSGKTKLREVVTRQADDQFTVVMYKTPQDGSEYKCMELVYTR